MVVVGADDGTVEVVVVVVVVTGTVVLLVEVWRLASPPPRPESCMGGAKSLPADTGAAPSPMR